MGSMERFLGTVMATVLLGLTLAACSPRETPAAIGTGGLDRLFERLHVTTNRDEARVIETTIRHAWASSARPDANRLMGRAIVAVHHGDLDQALLLLDQVVAQAPDLVAGWNLRATVHYARDDHAAALADIAQTLKLEPRHFGAWAGLGLIMQDRGNKAAALRAFETALRYNPHMTDLFEDVRQLRLEVTGLAL